MFESTSKNDRIYRDTCFEAILMKKLVYFLIGKHSFFSSLHIGT